MLDLDFASQVTAKLKARFKNSLITLLVLVTVVLVAMASFYVVLHQQYQALSKELTSSAAESTWQEIGEVRANANNLQHAWSESSDYKKFTNLEKNFTDLRRTLLLLERAGEKSVLDQHNIQYHLDDMSVYLSNAQKILIILVVITVILTIIMVRRTLSRFRWTGEYFQQLQQNATAEFANDGSIFEESQTAQQALAHQSTMMAASADSAPPPPPLPPEPIQEGDELDLAQVIMRGVRHLKRQKAQFKQQYAPHLVPSAEPLAASRGPAYLRKAMRFKTPLAVLLTDPADASPAQQVMNYSESGILIRFPHQEIGSLAPGRIVQGRLGTADRFSTFAGKVVRIEKRPNGDLVGIKFISSPW